MISGDIAETRVSVPELDKILGSKYPLLDDGFVRVVDYMGGDSSVVQAARVSYGKGTKTVNEDRGLIRYLMRHHHTTPFEMAEIKLHVRVPMDCWRQWIRHRTASVNEYSTRYSEAIDACQRTSSDGWRLQSGVNKQGSGDFLPKHAPEMPRTGGMTAFVSGEDLSMAEAALQHQAREVYEQRLQAGVAREQARKDLPLSTYTEAYWKTDLHNLLGFLRLRMDSHAQLEIRQYASVIGHEIVKRWVPHTWEAFQDYRMNSMSLTNHDVEIVNALAHHGGSNSEALELATGWGWMSRDEHGDLKGNRERDECRAKLWRLGVDDPWEGVK